MRVRLGPRNRESLACWLAARVPTLRPRQIQAVLDALIAYTQETVCKAVPRGEELPMPPRDS